MATISERISNGLEIRGMKQADLARLTGIGKSSISTYISGEYEPKQRNIYKIAKALNVNEAWLMGLDVPLVREQEPLAYDGEQLISFPIIGNISAGYDGLAVEEITDEVEHIPVSMLNGHSPDDFFVLRIKGDSMYPKLISGDRVLVLRCTSVDSGNTAVVLYNGEDGTVKRVKYVYGENWMELIPTNPEYKPRRIEGAELEQCRVLGKVIKLIRDID